MPGLALAPAARAFDAMAEEFAHRYGAWASVAAQRRAVRAALAALFPPGARLLELGGGTGEDALWLVERGRHVLLTDPSPAMVRLAAATLGPSGAPPPVVASAENLSGLRANNAWAGAAPLDGAFSNFAALNCVSANELESVARGLAPMIRPGGALALVLFGVSAPGEWIVQLARGNVRAAFRRFATGEVLARVAGREFAVSYHRAKALGHAFMPWFKVTARQGIGVFVPPSAAEPWITGRPRLLSLLERLDRVATRPLAPFGDHVLYVLRRTDSPAPSEIT